MSKSWKIVLYIFIPIIAIALIVVSYVFYNKSHSGKSSGGGSPWDTPLPPNSDFDHAKNFSFGKDLNYYLGDEINLLPTNTDYIYSYIIEDTTILKSTGYGKLEAKICGETTVSITYNNSQVYSTNISIKANISFQENENLIFQNDTIHLKQNMQILKFNFTNSNGESLVIDDVKISGDENVKAIFKLGETFISATQNGKLYINNSSLNIHLVYNIICDF